VGEMHRTENGEAESRECLTCDETQLLKWTQTHKTKATRFLSFEFDE